MSTSTFLKTFAVIVTYNGAPWLQRCLDSLSLSVPVPAIIVVDNASTDSTLQIASAHVGVTLIETGANLGFGRANNIGIACALNRGADFVFILNQDAHVAVNAIQLLVQAAIANPNTGILCPMQLNEAGTGIDPTFLHHYLAPNVPALINDAVLSSMAESYVASALPAAAWLFSDHFLMEVGGFDPLFFMYCEDDDLCSRATFMGYEVRIVPASTFYHCRGFHEKTSSESVLQKITRKASRLRSLLVRDAKAPGKKFSTSVWRSCVMRLAEGVTQLLNHRDWIMCVASIFAVCQVLTELHRIIRHREVCMGKGAHWLSLNTPNETFKE